MRSTRYTRYTREVLEPVVARERLVELVARATSLASVLEMLELPQEGRAHHDLKHRIRTLAIDRYRASSGRRMESR